MNIMRLLQQLPRLCLTVPGHEVAGRHLQGVPAPQASICTVNPVTPAAVPADPPGLPLQP
jgi:hypothetical protein